MNRRRNKVNLPVRYRLNQKKKKFDWLAAVIVVEKVCIIGASSLVQNSCKDVATRIELALNKVYKLTPFVQRRQNAIMPSPRGLFREMNANLLHTIIATLKLVP